MGGDSFEGVEKLTNAQYEKITSQLIQKLAPYCQKIQPYTPLPEKEVHGDVDLVMLTKDKLKCEDFIALIQPTKYKINNDNSFNMVYSKKQVDFVLVHTQNQFQLMHFYKSYSGLGGYLGVIRTVINIWKSMLIKSKKLIKNKRREINKMIESSLQLFSQVLSKQRQ